MTIETRVEQLLEWPTVVWSDVTEICGHITISMLWSNTAYGVKLSSENLSRCSINIEWVGFTNVRVITILLRKWQ